MTKPLANPIAAAGMRFAGACRFLFWTGWLAWTLAAVGVLYGEFVLRSPDPLNGYFFEALGCMVGWLIALYLADNLAMRVYRRSWRRLMQGALAPVALEQQVVERIRAELATDPLLRWFKPPRSRDVAGQLMTAALWWQAYEAPEGSGRWQRYGEWFIDALAGYLPLAAGVLTLVLWPTWKGSGAAAFLVGCGLATLGWSAIRLAARRQAIVDYFTAWRMESEG